MVRDSSLNLADLDKSLDDLIKEDRKRKNDLRKSRGSRGGRGGRGGRSGSKRGGGGGGSDAKSTRGRGRARGRGRGNSNNRSRGGRSRNGSNNNNNNNNNRGTSMKKKRGRGSGVSGYSYTEARGGGRSAAAKRAQSRVGGAASSQRRPLEVSTTGVLLIKGLQLHVTSDDVKEIFDRKGIVTSAFVKFDKLGKPTGEAEVTFARKQDAREAQRAFDGAKVDGVPISVRLAAFSPAKTTVVSDRRGARKPHPLKR